MEVKTYRVKSIPEAMPLILRDLGPEAAVLHTRELPPPRWQFWSNPQWEVVAGVDAAIPTRFQQYLTEAEELPWLSADVPAQEGSGGGETCDSNRQTRGTWGTGRSADQEVPIAAGRRPDSDVRPSSEASGLTWGRVEAELLGAGLAPTIVSEFLLDLSGNGSGDESLKLKNLPTWESLVQRFQQIVSFPGALEPATNACLKVALVGPTGVGKTTTIAKLAADFHLRQGLAVGLITMDTFRVGAVDQLQAYAQILGVPFRVVANAAEMAEAVAAFSTCQVVLIDTIGRSPRDRRRIEQMQTVLAAADLDHILLTLSASSDVVALQEAAREFLPTRGESAVSVVVTKVDEVRQLTHLHPVLTASGLPWRYWTNGQNVPDDLGVADPGVLTWFLEQIEFSSALAEPWRASEAGV